MKSPNTASRVLTLLLATTLLAVSATMAWATVNDFEERARVPKGVSVVGVDLSGMSASEAREAIGTAVAAPLLRPVTAQADGRSFTFDPRGTVTIDVDAMAHEAFTARRQATYLERVRHDVLGTPLSLEIEPKFAVDQSRLDEWLESIVEEVDMKAVDATVTVVDSRVKVRKSKTGRKIDVERATEALRRSFTTEEALADDDRVVVLDVDILEPELTEKDLGKTIVVDLSERRIRLYKGAKLEKTYRCAVGTGSYPTPRGEFKIVLKRYMPSWSNPAPNGWGKDMPSYIPPGPGNPLGTRALNLNAPGIRFHGTTKRYSVGTAASHGCMRMLREDIEDFYDRVKVGTKVFIVP